MEREGIEGGHGIRPRGFAARALARGWLRPTRFTTCAVSWTGVAGSSSTGLFVRP